MNVSLRGGCGIGVAVLLLSSVLAGCGKEEHSDPPVLDANLPVATASESGKPRAGGHADRRPTRTGSPKHEERSLQGSASKIVGDSLGRD